MASPEQRDPPKDLEDLLGQHGVDPSTISNMMSAGWSLSTFALAATAMDAFDPLMFESEASALQQARLRVCWREANLLLNLPASSSQPTAPLTTPEGSWHETFAPKLNPELIKRMKDDFKRFYPSESLNQDTMPSVRLLSLIYDQLSKKNWMWVPWKYRLSQAKNEEIKSQRVSKLPKIEGLALHELLIDEPPSVEVTNSGMGINGIRSILELRNFGIALCKAAHLGNLRALSHKFLSYLTVRLDGDLGLRCPNVLDSQSADKALWTSMADLMNEQGWSLDECLCEFSNVRSDLATLLQPRPKISRPPPAPPIVRPPGKGTRGYGKSKGKSSKGGKCKQTWVSEFQQNGEWKQICMKFQSNNCRMDNCKFAHVCAVPRSDNTACAGKHSAFDHQSTGH